jgi:hypothetical protein
MTDPVDGFIRGVREEAIRLRHNYSHQSSASALQEAFERRAGEHETSKRVREAAADALRPAAKAPEDDNYTPEELAAIRADYDAWFAKRLVWRPIDTAPTTARTLIGYAVKLPERWVRVGLGSNFRGQWMWHDDVPWGPATHWMPLVPPSAAVEGRAPSVISLGDETLPIPDADVPPDVAAELMRCAIQHGNISYRYLLDIYRKGRTESRAPGMQHREQHLASAMRKTLPPALLAEVIAHLDPLTPFVEFLRRNTLADSEPGKGA